ncbi:MAG TPA: metalloregulator ArsR/SmtB family transcription factor [Gaiellaceae bacterium]|nr:metalloregulator ArsR/SmtB family transcription factor [Gaiellaceae bacterium]
MEAANAIADPIRRRVLELVRDEEWPAGALAAEFRVSRPAVSRHLRVLREAGLVVERREGRQRLYRANLEPLEELRGWLDDYWAGRLRTLKALAEKEKT